jgi:anti-anti-sigma regulatory factor/PAS domain-containing protein
MNRTAADYQHEIEALRDQVAQMALLLEVSHQLSSANDPEGLMQALLPVIQKVKADSVNVTFIDPYDETPQWAEITAAWSASGSAVLSPGMRFYIPDFPMSSMILSGPYIIPNADEPTVGQAESQVMKMAGILASVNLTMRQGGKIMAALSLNWGQPHPFSQAEKDLFQSLQAMLTPTIANLRLRAAQEQIIQQRTEALRQSEMASARKFASIIEALPLGINIYTLEAEDRLVLTGANPQADAITGVECRQLFGLTIEQAFPALAQTEIPDHYRRAAREGKPWHTEQITYEDDRISGAFEVYVFQSEPGTAVVAFLNITERKQAEAERARLQQQVIDAQRAALQELSTPIIPIMERIVVMPLVGAIDTGRSRDVMRALLSGISQYRAHIAILDITGVPVVDSGVAQHLSHTIQAARLKGAQTIITGVSDAVAETIVDLGIDWSGVETLRDLQSGLMVALDRLGYRVSQYDPKSHAR